METQQQAQRLKNLHLRAVEKRRQVQQVSLKLAEPEEERTPEPAPFEEKSAVPERPEYPVEPPAQEADWADQDLPDRQVEWEQFPVGYGDCEQAGIAPPKEQIVFDEAGILEEEEKQEKEKHPPVRKKRLFSWGRILLTILFAASLTAWIVARHNAAFADFYTRNIYPKLASVLGFLTGWAPFSLAECLSVAAILAASVCLIVFIIRMIAKKGRGLRLLRGFLALLFTASAVFSCFVWTAGINYARPTWAESAGVEVQKSDREDLARLYHNLIEAANREADQVERKGDAMPKAGNVADVARQADALMNRLAGEDKAMVEGAYSRAKPVFFSAYMCYTRITGIFFPFTGEANINRSMPEIEYPVTVCHELSHQRGIMREEEANFLAVKACLRSDDPSFRYSGLLMAMTYAGNALYEEDRALWKKTSADMSTLLRSDRKQIALFWEQYDTPVGEVSEQVNDAYLQANGQSQGVKSYGAFLDLMLSDPELSALCS